MPKVKLCWWCRHFYYSNGCPDYSEYTPGWDFEMSCENKHWCFDANGTSQDEFARMLSSAETCKDFKSNIWHDEEKG